MKTPDSKIVKSSKKCSTKTVLSGIKNPVKRINRCGHKAGGKPSHANPAELLDEKRIRRSAFKDALGTGSLVPNRVTFVTEAGAIQNLHPGQTLVSSTKIKLQLFPINRDTRAGLEKDGHNPYLELTLRAQKKISSVLKHLGKKWGSSRVAIGEPMLFPYNTTENLSNCQRWTLNDDDMTAGQVYVAVGNPAIFRLRYGWFCIHQPRLYCMPSTLIPPEAGVQPGVGAQGGRNTGIETLYDEGEKAEVTSQEYNAIDEGDAANSVVPKEIDNVSVDKLGTGPRTSSVGQPSLLWDDSLTNISIGALLSEVSLQGKFGISDPKSYLSNSDMHPNQIIHDSSDACISSLISHSQYSRQLSEDLRTSILDAEETCHAFPLQKLSFSGKGVQTPNGTAYSGACSLGGSSNSLKFRNANKVNDPAGLAPDLAFWKTETDILLSSRAYDDERSLGLTGIKWNDSLGPFDLGLPTQKLNGGDGVSIGEFVR